MIKHETVLERASCAHQFGYFLVTFILTLMMTIVQWFSATTLKVESSNHMPDREFLNTLLFSHWFGLNSACQSRLDKCVFRMNTCTFYL